MSEGTTINPFKGTKEVYGVDPKVLANMTYKEATELKLAYAKRELNKLAAEMKTQWDVQSFTRENYARLASLNRKFNELQKAIKLAELQLEELRAAGERE